VENRWLANRALQADDRLPRSARAPTDDDFIVPTRNMTERLSPEAQNAFTLDLKILRLRHRRGHDLRRTFITLAQVDGARRDLLETITHGPRGNIVNVYTTFPWPALCAEVAKLRITKVRTGGRENRLEIGGRTTRSRRRAAIACDRSCYRSAKLAESLAKECDPSGIRIAAKQRETTRGFAVSVGDVRSEIGERSRRYVER
jgi:hypothetical protein